MRAPRIIITCGDVNGIGLRCLAGAIEQLRVESDLHLAISPTVLRSCIGLYHLPVSFYGGVWTVGSHSITVEPLDNDVNITPGMAADDASRHAIASLEFAFENVRSGTFDAVVTLPINKHALGLVGWQYPGQTEMAAAFADGEPLMVLCTRTLHVALATVHIPLRDVADALSTDAILRRIIQLHSHLRTRAGVISPRIAVLGLNPHAGEQGRIGTEDEHVIRPAIDQANQMGIDATGPVAADGFFGFGAYRNVDGVLAMYHDQGLIPLKLLAKGAGVNVTAGLSIIRTSPDHGTAYDAVNRADVDSASTCLAIEMAIEMAQRRIS
ncbi:MAG: 4-hydroxythreonine-4-phosphate dehydrogenase PdxA [Candidatus Kapabacteria bacterium]|nr:4-hydroxythreonine-4-phosphate dehydrogenase PdxA [Candidatus Kapabacteria bacterium]